MKAQNLELLGDPGSCYYVVFCKSFRVVCAPDGRAALSVGPSLGDLFCIVIRSGLLTLT